MFNTKKIQCCEMAFDSSSIYVSQNETLFGRACSKHLYLCGFFLCWTGQLLIFFCGPINMIRLSVSSSLEIKCRMASTKWTLRHTHKKLCVDCVERTWPSISNVWVAVVGLLPSVSLSLSLSRSLCTSCTLLLWDNKNERREAMIRFVNVNIISMAMLHVLHTPLQNGVQYKTFA